MSKFHSDDLIIKEGHEILRKATADVSLPPTVEAKEELSAMLSFYRTARTRKQRKHIATGRESGCLQTKSALKSDCLPPILQMKKTGSADYML
ncbi:hypothetical protein [Bacillus sonorensis]|uniref:hypothetical protein n=1 Tax=Bacillus sonorensis TaxID=119858 RepID=UPI000495C297|nr:hypothetical protein [Bacillus sonorensis]